MSSRQLRKLQKQRELEQEHGAEKESSSEDDGDTAPGRQQPRVSLFAALGGEDGTNSDQEGDGEDDDDEEPEGEDLSLRVSHGANEPAPTPVGGKKSKKKKKNKKKKATTSTEPSRDDSVKGQSESGEDEIDKAIKELQLTTRGTDPDDSTSTAQCGHTHTSRLNKLLSINTYHLKAVNEMRTLFGREVIDSTAQEEQQEDARRRGRRNNMPRQVDLETFLREPPGAKRLPEVTLRRNIFIQGKEHWPRQSAMGLTMKEVGKHDEWVEYAFCHDKDYDSLQAVFFAYVQMGDPMRMVHLLKEMPYHVSTLLQVSSVAKQDQNMALAAELCERALFTFGRVATSAFRQDIEKGRARLEFRRPENRQFWLAGYHYLKSLIRKGTYRTALEWAKLMYSLDHEDPYGMRHYIHFLAIRAHESKWLLDFVAELERGDEHGDLVYLQQSLVLAKQQMGDDQGAREVVQEGLRTVPWLYCALFQELGLDAPPSIWGISTQNDAQEFWVKLYLYQTKELWNYPNLTTMLKNVAQTMDKVDVSQISRHDPTPDLAAVRLVYLEGQTSLLSVAPRKLLDSQPNYEFDPLPPPKEENIFTAGEGSRLPWADQSSQQRDNSLLARMHRMMNARQQRQLNAAGGAGAAAGGNVGGGGGGALAAALQGDDDGDELEENWSDDEELRRDLEMAAGGDRNGASMLDQLMQLLGMRVPEEGPDANAAAAETTGVSGSEDVDADREGDGDEPPGAWPNE